MIFAWERRSEAFSAVECLNNGRGESLGSVEKAETFDRDAGGTVKLDTEEKLCTRRGYWLLRRGQDILLSLLALAVLAPACCWR